MRTLFASVALTVTLGVHAGATTIIVLRTPASIVLAGDSKSTLVGTGRFPGGECKIRKAGPWHIIVGGYTKQEPLDVRDLMVKAVSPTRTIASALVAVDQVYRTRLREILMLTRANPRNGELFRAGRPVLSVLVAGSDHGTLSVGYFGLTATATDLSTDRMTCPGTLCPDSRLFYGASISDKPAVHLIVTTPRPAWLQRGDAAAARRLITMQIAATPERVGLPIDVLEITSRGAAWVQPDRASACR